MVRVVRAVRVVRVVRVKKANCLKKCPLDGYNIKLGLSGRAAYSDLNPDDGGQSLYPMGTVFKK